MPPAAGGAGAAPAGGGGMPPAAGAGGGIPPLAENRKRMLTEAEYDIYLENMVAITNGEPSRKKEIRHKEIIKENSEINENLNRNAQTMIEEISVLLKNTESINKEQKIDEGEDVDFESIENIEIIE
jgi:hypothetical protein